MPGQFPRDQSRLVQAGYQHLMDTTGLSKKTIQRVIDRLIAKDFISVERPADIYERNLPFTGWMDFLEFSNTWKSVDSCMRRASVQELFTHGNSRPLQATGLVQQFHYSSYSNFLPG
jgi:hypothetical protein